MDKAIFEKLPFWKDTSENEKTYVTERAKIKEFEKGEIIRGNEGCLGMFMILSGEIRTFLLSEEGREITLFRTYVGECSILSASCIMREITFESQIVAQSPVSVLLIPTPVFNKLCEENIYVKCFMYELAAKRFSDVMFSFQQILFKGFDRRLASFLVSEYDRTGSDKIKMTHEEIAKHTSSAREVVARMLKSFSADGLIESKRGCIEIKDIEALRLLE